jgi:hypothetical protein
VEAQAVSFLKKNWPFLALFVAVGVILTLLMLLDRAQDDAIASMMADRTVAKHRAAREAIITKYAILNAAKDQELITWRQGNKVLAAKIVAKQKELNVKVTTLAEAEAKYEKLNAFLGEISYTFTEKLSECDRLWGEKLALKDAEIAEWKAKDASSAKTIGDLTMRVAALALNKQKRLVVGPQAGYGLQGYHVGFGITWELFRFKAPGQ